MRPELEVLKKALNIHSGKGRLWEVDAFRGFAILLMAFYHFMWDLSFYGFVDLNMLHGFWQVFARVIASLFLFVSGISVTIGYQRSRAKGVSGFDHVLIRGMIIFGWGLLISYGSFLEYGFDGGIVFGILHLLGVGVILGYLAAMLPLPLVLLLVPGVSVLGWHLYFHVFSESPWYLWFGVRQYGRLMYDYYPLLPWLAPLFFGVFGAKLLFKEGKPIYPMADLSSTPPCNFLALMGRYSLPIYLVHQPVLYMLVGLAAVFK